MSRVVCPEFDSREGFNLRYVDYGCLGCANIGLIEVIPMGEEEQEEELTIPKCGKGHKQYSVTWRQFSKEDVPDV